MLMSFFHVILQSNTTTATTDQTIQSVFGLITVLLGGSSVIGIAINRIFDTKNIKVIVELQSEIKSLQREANYRENDLNRLEVENNELREKIAALQEKTNSNFSEQLVNIQEKYQHLATEHQKAIAAIAIIKKLKGVSTNASNSNTNDGNQT
jgi:predicted RNase H-like nuclease (RuvC/YqgF family)